MRKPALEVPAYPSDQIRPFLKIFHRRDKVFCPQTVPSYAATETLNFIRTKWPDYTYKEATLNPTNLRDRAVEWESDLISKFRNDSTATELTGVRQNASGGESLFMAHPLRPKKSCLECHSTPAAAPASMVRVYGPNNGFYWKECDVIRRANRFLPVGRTQGSGQCRLSQIDALAGSHRRTPTHSSYF